MTVRTLNFQKLQSGNLPRVFLIRSYTESVCFVFVLWMCDASIRIAFVTGHSAAARNQFFSFHFGMFGIRVCYVGAHYVLDARVSLCVNGFAFENGHQPFPTTRAKVGESFGACRPICVGVVCWRLYSFITRLNQF